MDRPDPLSSLLSAIEDGPGGPRIGAFFDFDGTIIAGYSAAKFYQDRLRRRDVSLRELRDLLLAFVELAADGDRADRPYRTAIAQWRGRSERALEELSERLFRERIAACVYPEARALIEAHRRKEHTVVIATSATRFQAAPAARELGVEHLLCTAIEVRDGEVTGKVVGPVLWGQGKADAVRRFAASRGLSLAESHAYADGDEDLPFLETVGHPRVMNPRRGLAARASERGWPVLRCAPRGTSLRLTPVVRTGAAVAALGAAVGVAAAVGLARRSRRDAANLAISMGCDLVLRVTGVRVKVVGEEHLWSHRPAVFVFNHQSGIDPFVLGSLLRRDVTAVAKKQLARDPRVAPAAYLVNVVFVDRGDTVQAKQALAPVVERLRSGVSLAIAPEGTRSLTGHLGPFKKGAFHLALQAGVPMVPIVIHDSGAVMWARSNVVHPGTVDVTVLPPVDTRRWSAETIDAHVAEVRRMFLEALEGGPERPRGGHRAAGQATPPGPRPASLG